MRPSAARPPTWAIRCWWAANWTRPAVLTFVLQIALYIPASFGLIGQQLCLPLLSGGSVMLAADGALVGVMLSVLRGANLPENHIPRAVKRRGLTA